SLSLFYFFFQAEDGIRDDLVTGVQTCALPIFACPSYSEVKRFQRHLATVTFERFSQVRRILAGADSALRTGHDPPIDLGVTTFRRRSICRPDAGVPGLFGCGRANTDRSRR